jgi:hypothetical protein
MSVPAYSTALATSSVTTSRPGYCSSGKAHASQAMSTIPRAVRTDDGSGGSPADCNRSVNGIRPATAVRASALVR